MHIPMRWQREAILGTVLLAIAFLFWPVLGLKRLADAVAARDAATFMRLVDLPQLKRSMGGQLARASLRVSNPGRRLSPLALNLATQAGMSAADAYVVKIVQAESMFDILEPATLENFGGRIATPHARTFPSLRNIGKLLSSELRGRNFYVTIPLSAGPQQGYRLRLRLSQWKWKLAGVDLPEEVADRLAREVMRLNHPGPSADTDRGAL
jgi:hypothetical protein